MHQILRNNYQGSYQKLFLLEQKNQVKLPCRVESVAYVINSTGGI
jgi:hypothetical protein